MLVTFASTLLIAAVYETEPDNYPRLMELMSDIQVTPESDEKTLSAETAHGVVRADLDRCHVQAAQDGCEKMPVLRTAQRR